MNRSIFERFKNNSQHDWLAYTQHDFVQQLGHATLDKNCFQHYLKQDYLFLIQFIRAWGLAVYKSDNLADMRFAQKGINTLLDTEISLHIKYCKEWGISESELQSVPESSATVAYTRYVLDCGVAGDLTKLYVALSPCIIGYGEIACWLNGQSFTQRQGNPYNEWIEMYLSDEYQEIVTAKINLLEKLCSDLSEARLQQLDKVFRTATRMETSFWQMGLDLSD